VVGKNADLLPALAAAATTMMTTNVEVVAVRSLAPAVVAGMTTVAMAAGLAIRKAIPKLLGAVGNIAISRP
jgi:hypothetical protein